MRRAALAALLLLACTRKQAPPAPVTPDAAPPEASAIYVAHTEPPSIWRVTPSGKTERLHIHVDAETVDAPEGSTLPRVSPDGKTIALVRAGKLVLRDVSSGRESELSAKRALIAAFCASGPLVDVQAPGEIVGCLADGALLLDEAPRAQLAAKRLLRWKPGQVAEPIALPDGEYGQFDVGRKFVVAAAASGKQSRIVRLDLARKSVEAVTIAGDYRWPRLSPNEQQVAFERGGEVWLRDHLVIQPADQLVDFDWIDDRTLVVETAAQLIVVGVDRAVKSVVARERGE